jgi:tubby-related protein 1
MSFRVRTSIKLDEITDRRIFVNSTVPKGKMVQCTIKRYKSGFDIFRPQYDLFLSDECVYLMSGKKKAGNTSNYVISTDKGDF